MEGHYFLDIQYIKWVTTSWTYSNIFHPKSYHENIPKGVIPLYENLYVQFSLISRAFIFFMLYTHAQLVTKYVRTICPRSSFPIYIVAYYIKWVTTSWAHSTYNRTNIQDIVIMYQFLGFYLDFGKQCSNTPINYLGKPQSFLTFISHGK